MSTFAVHLLSRRQYMPNCNRRCRKRVGSIFFIRYFKHSMYDETLLFWDKYIEKSRSRLFFCINDLNDFYLFKQFLKHENKSHHFYKDRNRIRIMQVCVLYLRSVSIGFSENTWNFFFFNLHFLNIWVYWIILFLKLEINTNDTMILTAM